MANSEIKRGMSIFDANGQTVGTVENISNKYFVAGGQQYPLNSGYRIENDAVYLTGSGTSFTGTTQEYTGTDQNKLRVPVMEEQLQVGKREKELGEVQIHKSVTQQQVNVPVELRREEVSVQEVDVPNRPVQPGEATFQEGTIRVPVRGEEAVVAKQAVVTGEVNINKNVKAEQQTVSDTVRKEQVNVDKNYEQTRPQAQVVDQTPVAQYQPQVDADADADAAGYTEATPAGTGYGQAQLQEDMPVYTSDGNHIGRVKELRDTNFLLGRGFFKGDLDADYSSIRSIDNGNVNLNFTEDQINEMS